MVRLVGDVEVCLMPPRNDAAGKKTASAGRKEPIRVTGKSLDFERDSRTMQLYGPVEAETHTAHLRAGKLTLALDAVFRAEKLVAAPGPNGKNPELESQGADGPTNLSAETITAQFAPAGWLTRIEGMTDVRGSRRTGKEVDDFHAERGAMELWPRVNQPRELKLKGSVQLKTQADNSGEARMLQTSELLLEFADAKKGEGSKLKRAETLGAGSIEWTDAAAQSGAPGDPANSEAARTKLKADKLEMEFGNEGKARQLVASGNVLTERTAGGKPVQTATARSGVAQLLASGGWSQMDLQGAGRLREGDRSGQADHATFVRATQTELRREARVRNAIGHVRAVSPQAAGESRAQTGAVQAGPKKPRLWHVTAGTLTYRDAESRAHLEKNVVAQSAEQIMHAAVVDLYFTRAGKTNSNAANGLAVANPAAGAQQISRAVGTGGVIVEQGTRKATAERGEYNATDGKFIMSGGNPAIYDAVEGTKKGRQLTSFLAEDTIIVDSENGSRTLTKHRVEK